MVVGGGWHGGGEVAQARAHACLLLLLLLLLLCLVLGLVGGEGRRGEVRLDDGCVDAVEEAMDGLGADYIDAHAHAHARTCVEVEVEASPRKLRLT